MLNHARCHRRRSLLALAAVLVATSSCSSRAAKPDPNAGAAGQQAPRSPASGDDSDSDGMQVEGTLGSLSDEAIQAGLGRSVSALDSCFQQQVKKEPYLGGELTLQFRVARDGSLKRVRISQSSIGSLSVERCALASVGKVKFEAPHGGEAEFNYPLKFQGRLTAQAWDPGMVKQEILDHIEQLLAASKTKTLQAPAGLVITFYVNGRGRVASAGMTADDPISPEFADRFVENLRKLSFEAVVGGYAKVTYTW